jgi:hypothetical protein
MLITPLRCLIREQRGLRALVPIQAGDAEPGPDEAHCQFDRGAADKPPVEVQASTMAKRDPHSAFDAGLRYHRREWAVQRVGWLLMTIAIAAAVAGIFGDGPLSQTTSHARLHSAQYERFARYGTRTKLVVNVTQEASANPIASVRISRSFMDAYHIEAITPEPERTSVTGDDVAFMFEASSTASITFRLEPDTVGRHSGYMRIGSESMRISQFVYP